MTQNMHKTQVAESTDNTAAPLPSPQRARARRGFAVMDVERVRAIARMGGKAAHNAGTAHEFTPDEARSAGRKGGLAPHRPRTTKSQREAAAAASQSEAPAASNDQTQTASNE